MSCLGLELVPARRKSCAVTRSFSGRVTERAELGQAVAAHAARLGSARLGEKLRREGLGTNHITIFYHTSEHDRGEPMRSISTVVTLPEATNDTLALIPTALHGVARTWREQGCPPWRYSKAGVVTVDLVPLAASQRALIGRFDRERSTRVMGAMDACNVRFVCGSVVPTRARLAQQRRTWTKKFEMRTQCYTTQVDELPVAQA